MGTGKLSFPRYSDSLMQKRFLPIICLQVMNSRQLAWTDWDSGEAEIKVFSVYPPSVKYHCVSALPV